MTDRPGDGTSRALRPVAESVLDWVAKQRSRKSGAEWTHASDDDLRRIELCARTAQDVAMFHDLFKEN